MAHNILTVATGPIVGKKVTAVTVAELIAALQQLNPNQVILPTYEGVTGDFYLEKIEVREGGYYLEPRYIINVEHY